MLDGWRSWALVERGLASATIEVYERELRLLERPVLGALERLETTALRERLHEQGGSASTVARRLAAWRSYYGWLVRTGRRSDDPTAGLDRPKVSRGLPRPVANPQSATARLDSPYREIAVLIVETGLRISEACTLEVAVPVPGQVTVHGKGGKDRVIPLTGQARRALTLLGGRVEVSARSIQRAFHAAGFTPHQLRHTFATELAEADVDLSVIQDLLGHASPATTRIYQANSAARLRRGIERRREAGAG